MPNSSKHNKAKNRPKSKPRPQAAEGKPAPAPPPDAKPKGKRGPRKNGKILGTEKTQGTKRVVVTAKIRATTKNKPRGKPFEPGNPWRFKEGNKFGTGRPKEVSEAYRVYLRSPIGEGGETGAELVAQSVMAEAMGGNIPAATEIRKATEGDKLDIGGFSGMSLEDLYRSMEAFLGGMGMEELTQIRELVERVYQARIQMGEGAVIENTPPALPQAVQVAPA